MKLWMSAEMQADVADAYRETRKAIESEVNHLLEGIPVDDAADEWAFIAIIRTEDHPDYGEIVKRSSRGRVLEFRLKISHAEFLAATQTNRIRQVLQELSRSVKLMSQLKVSGNAQATIQAVLASAEKRLLC
jgi:hypothetical protein